MSLRPQISPERFAFLDECMTLILADESDVCKKKRISHLMRLSFLEGMSAMASCLRDERSAEEYYFCYECRKGSDSCRCSEKVRRARVEEREQELDEKWKKAVGKYILCTRCDQIYQDDQIREDEEYVCESCEYVNAEEGL
uniref:Uncharacterized protein n=1 Tax=viral metagenome TaxID=1070528 RepID=A0A6C0KGN5_9ZZZZ